MPVFPIKNLSTLLLLAATAASCTSVENKYKSTDMLERPPTLIGIKPAEAQSDDAETPPKEAKAGLGDEVTMIEANPPRLRINQGFAQAWSTITSVLKQENLEITDRNRDKGLFYVTYDADSYKPDDAGFFSSLLPTNDYPEEGYILNLQGQGGGTEITAEVANKTASAAEDEATPADGAEKLLKTLYKTLRDKVKKEE